MFNLTSNHSKFTNPGSIKSKAAEADKGWIKLEIIDFEIKAAVFLKQMAEALDLKTDARTRVLSLDRFAGSDDSDSEVPVITENNKTIDAEIIEYNEGGMVLYESSKLNWIIWFRFTLTLTL